MADDADIAQSRQELLNSTALDHHRNRQIERPVLIDDVVCCRDCGDPIPEDRLRQVCAARCFFCQEIHECRTRTIR